MKKIYTILATVFITLNSFGANQTVVNTNDSGVGSLRDALTLINSGDTIFFTSSLAGSVITLNSQITLSADVVIQGLLTGNTVTISGGNNTRIFNIASSINATVNWIDIANGKAIDGGAIFNNGNLSLTYCKIYNNVSNLQDTWSYGGGAIYNPNGSVLTIENCELFDNLTQIVTGSTAEVAKGGAIFNSGEIYLNSSSLYRNKVENNIDISPSSSFSDGGAIYSSGTNAVLEINSCTISYNECLTTGADGRASGGGIYSAAANSLLINHSTINQNSINSLVANSRGGNIYNIFTAGSIYNTIIANGISSVNTTSKDIYNGGSTALTSSGYNVFEYTPDGLALTTGDVVTDPLLDTLVYNYGAFTQTHGLLTCSPAFNAGSNIAAPVLDQAGQPRIVGTTIDIGALEAQANMPSLPNVTANSTSTNICQGDTITLTGGGADTYTWDNTAIIDGVPLPMYGTYTYTVTGTETATGCVNTASITITVNPAPAIPVVSLSGTNLTTGTYLTYQWYLGGIIIAGETSQTISPTQDGFYSVEVADSNGCPRRSNEYNYSTVSINEFLGFNIKVYPNPTENILNFENIEFTSVTIFNNVGQKIKVTVLTKGYNQISVAELPKGFYILQFATEKSGIYSTSFIKK